MYLPEVIILISINYSGNIFAIFTDNEIFTTSEKIYDPIEEIKQPSMPIYMNKNFFKSMDNAKSDEMIGNLIKNSIRIDRGL